LLRLYWLEHNRGLMVIYFIFASKTVLPDFAAKLDYLAKF